MMQTMEDEEARQRQIQRYHDVAEKKKREDVSASNVQVKAICSKCREAMQELSKEAASGKTCCYDRCSKPAKFSCNAEECAYHLCEKHSKGYYTALIDASVSREDQSILEDRKQIKKDLSRTFGSFPPVPEALQEPLQEALGRILTAYVERGRSLSITGQAGAVPKAAHVTTARGVLAGYSQGLNFFAGMCLYAAGAACLNEGGEELSHLEEISFWLLAFLIEDILDPDFFGGAVNGDRRMAFIGGVGMRNFIVERAEEICPAIRSSLGKEAFSSSIGNIMDPWVLPLFVGNCPHRLLERLWDDLLLPSIYHPPESSDSKKRLPRGLASVIAFALAALKCCGEDRLRGSQILARVDILRQQNRSAEDISLEACEAIQGIRTSFRRLDAAEEENFIQAWRDLTAKYTDSKADFERLWSDLKEKKKQIVDQAVALDENLMEFARANTHFTVEEIKRLKDELKRRQVEEKGPDENTFKELVRKVVPEFPQELCGRLFRKLDQFDSGGLAFVHLACGMSALSLGTMDEKLQVCFDLFDSEGRRALTLPDLGDLCTTLFRVALSQGLQIPMSPSTDEVLDNPLRKPRQDKDLLLAPSSSSMIIEYTTASNTSSSSRSSSSRPFLNTYTPGSPTPSRVPGEVQIAKTNGAWDSSRDPPWRSMLLRLHAAAQVRTPGGPWLVAFEDFRNAALMEPALLCLFSWCFLPRPPDSTGVQFGDPGDPPAPKVSAFRRICGNILRFLAPRRFRRQRFESEG